ncbi:MAG: PxKF domain-containing protein, partial [Intrasporangium sp.]|uniref:PxKF domain-containing protein n=1 Tax=Intrasporangium sp. TaxID=1925024 RepID=UPI003F7CF639
AAANGDVAATNNSGNLKFGNVACKTDNVATATLWIVRKSANNKETFANGATVTFTVKTVEGAGLTAASPTATITLPNNWTGSADDTASKSVTAPVHLLSTTSGAGNGKVTYEASGRSATGTNATLTLSTFVNVSWTTGPCVTNTPPTVTVAGPTAGASYEYGQAPTATCMVTDKEDGPSSFPATITPGTDVVDGIGSYTASCSYTDSGGLTGAASVTYSVSKIPTSVAITCPPSVTYTGLAQEPCTAVVSGRDLPSGTNAPITYGKNMNAGTATVNAVYAGDSHYGGSSASSSFQIIPATSKVTITCQNLVYTGEVLTPCTAVVSGAGMEDLSVPVNFPEATNAGTWTATASWEGDANHYGSSDSQEYTIDKAPSKVTVSCDSGSVYTGSQIKPCSAVATGVGMNDVSLEVKYANNVDAGIATASASWEGDDNHVGDSDSATFEIGKADSTIDLACDSGSVYTGSAIEPCHATVTGAGGLNQGVSVTYTDNTNAGTATATASYGGDDNHKDATKSTTFEIAKADSTVTISCPAIAWFTGSEIKPCSATVTGAGGLNQPVAITYGNNTKVGTATASATYAGDDNHTSSSASASFTIKGFTLNGFYQPVDMGMLNTVKAGSTVPLKFAVLSNGVKRTDVAVVAGFSTKGLACSSLSDLGEAPVDVISTGGTALRYDASAGQFIQNWQTPKTPGSCYRVTMTTIDGGSITADFKLK